MGRGAREDRLVVQRGVALLLFESEAILEETLRELRGLLDTVPDKKTCVRALLGQDHLDVRTLFESGVFDPQLTDYMDFAHVVERILGDKSGRKLEGLDRNARFELVHKARAPRVRAATRDKIAATITDALSWQVERLSDLYEMFTGAAPKAKAAPARPKAAAKPTKPLPKLPE